MNNRFTQGSPVRDGRLRQLLDKLRPVSGGNLGPNYDIKPTNDALTVIPAGRDAGYEIHAMRFGLWQAWMEGRESKYATFNARWETVPDSRMWGPLWRDGKRAAVPASGWYEWSGPTGSKRRWHFSLGEPDGLFWFAALHEQAQNRAGEAVRSFSLLTVPANSLVGEYHSTPKDPGGRMPVILETNDVPAWLDAAPEAAAQMIRTWPTEKTAVWEVPRKDAIGIAQAQPLGGAG